MNSKKFVSTFQIFFLLVFSMLLIFSFTVNLENKRSITRFDIIAKGIGILTLVVLVYTAYINERHNSKIQEDIIRQNSYQISKNFYTDMMNQMKGDFPESYFIFNEIEQAEDLSTEELEKLLPHNQYKRRMLENYYANLILENLENWISLRKYLTASEGGWLMSFYYQLQSPIVQATWENYQNEYDPATNSLVKQFISIGEQAKKENLTDEQVYKKVTSINIEKLVGEKEKGL
jgi:hypothetical protein